MNYLPDSFFFNQFIIVDQVILQLLDFIFFLTGAADFDEKPNFEDAIYSFFFLLLYLVVDCYLKFIFLKIYVS